MIETLVVATGNRKKVREIERMLGSEGVRIETLADYPDCPETVEDADTFEGNALKKARTVCAYTGKPSLADDSGLVVDALDGRPGVYSARYAGADARDADNNALLRRELEGVEDARRTGRFVCVMAYVTPQGEERTFRGTVEGRIGYEPAGDEGFGYDPLFYPLGHERTFAQMEGWQKDAMSHRGRALQEFVQWLRHGQ